MKLFLPSRVKSIERVAFAGCQLLRLLIPPYDTNQQWIIDFTAIYQIVETAGVEYAGMVYAEEDGGDYTDEDDSRRVNDWLFHHMDQAPFHKLCYDSSITTKQINNYINENGNASALAVDPHHGMTPLHIPSMNPHAPANAILALFKANIYVANVEDNRGNILLYYALHYNPTAFVRMHSYLCENCIENVTQSLGVNHHNDNPRSTSTPLHVLATNPFAPADTIAALLELKMEAVFCLDDERMSPLDYAKECNVDGLVSMMNVLCIHRNYTASMVGNKALENPKKRKILQE